MPFQSQAQRAYLYANVPKVAAEFAAATSKKQEKNLPKYKKQKKGK